MNFIAFLDANPHLKNKRPIHPPYKPYWITKAIKHFNTSIEYVNAIHGVNTKKFTSLKFNGDIVKERYGLEGKELGKFIVEFYKRVDKKDLENIPLLDIDNTMHMIYKELFKDA